MLRFQGSVKTLFENTLSLLTKLGTIIDSTLTTTVLTIIVHKTIVTETIITIVLGITITIIVVVQTILTVQTIYRMDKLDLIVLTDSVNNLAKTVSLQVTDLDRLTERDKVTKPWISP